MSYRNCCQAALDVVQRRLAQNGRGGGQVKDVVHYLWGGESHRGLEHEEKHTETLRYCGTGMLQCKCRWVEDGTCTSVCIISGNVASFSQPVQSTCKSYAPPAVAPMLPQKQTKGSGERDMSSGVDRPFLLLVPRALVATYLECQPQVPAVRLCCVAHLRYALPREDSGVGPDAHKQTHIQLQTMLVRSFPCGLRDDV